MEVVEPLRRGRSRCHWMPEEQPEALLEQLLTFFA
jgi:hypothetical protein